MRLLLAAALIGLAGLAHAEPLDTAEAFESYVSGKTLYFERGDGRGVFAAESYLQDRKVRWTERDGTCVQGEWYARDRLICFIYENNPNPQCWQVELAPSGLRAVLQNGDVPTRISEADAGNVSFECLGPKIGV